MRGESLTMEEEQEAVRLVRQDRQAAAKISANSKAKTVKADPTAVLDKLKGLLGPKKG